MKNVRHITLPEGFVAAGVKCGIKTSGKEDLAIIVGLRKVSAALLTTTNQVIGEPVRWCRQVLPEGCGSIRGIVINAGVSNVCTGRKGFKDAQAMAAQTAALVGARQDEILVASTGIIGHPLPMGNIRRGIAQAAAQLGRSDDSSVLRAIMTTDTREKSAVAQVRIAGRKVTVAGMVKGAGMMAPSLATMLCVLTTDALVAPPLLRKLFRPAVAASLNAVTVDSDMSTSDTAVILASGASGAKIVAGSASEKKFAAALGQVLTSLAMAIARDGEGATKLIEITLAGAASDAQARAAAMSVANSPLFKCAVHGGDPNWGRILCALGKSPAKVQAEKTVVKIGGAAVFVRGRPAGFNLKKVRAHLQGPTVLIDVNLGLGKGRFRAYTCDLSREYITINADYHT